MRDEDSLMASEGSMYKHNNKGYTNNISHNETVIIQDINLIVSKRTFGHMRPAKIQISLRIRAV